MTKWAILEEGTNKVLSIVSSNNRPVNGVKGQDPSCKVGYFWNGWTFDAPRWTSYQFLQRFTPQERAIFRSAALVDVNVADFQMLATAAQEVIADDPVTILGMDYLVSQGLLTEQRKNEILGV